MEYQQLELADGSGEIEEARRVQSSRPINDSRVRMSAVATAVSALARWSNEASVASAVEDAVDGIQENVDSNIRYWSDNNPDGECYLVEQCGCLIHVVLSRPSNWPDPRPLTFEAAFIAECGLTPSDALNRYLSVPAAIQGTPEGTESVWRFIWARLS